MMENKMQDLENILTKFMNIVSPNFCESLARKTGFVKRSTSQLKGYEFAQAMMIPNAFLETETLNSLAVRMNKANNSCKLSASALAQRINTTSAARFMKACLGYVLKELIRKDIAPLSDLPHLAKFNRILIQDSTKAELHEKLSPYFKGSGGAASKSAVKIDYIFDYQSEETINVEFFSGNIPDQTLANRIIALLEKNDLVLRDLGYYLLDSMKKIEEKEAYYASRFKVDVNVYESEESRKPLDLAKFLDEKIFHGIVDETVFLGAERHPVRLIACLMSEEAINKRLRDANRTASRRGAQISKKKKNLLKYSIFITNIPAQMLSAKEIMPIYRARWRVELIFKQWKSCLKLHIFKGFNKDRFHCFMYGRLIMAILMGSLGPPLMRYAFELGRELSCYKLINYLIADHMFFSAIQNGKINELICRLLEDFSRRLCMEKRKRQSLRSNVREGISYYNELKMIELELNVA